MFLKVLSDITGWIYFFAWSISFYPQVILNYRRKETNGLSCEFLWYNVLGFIIYTVYTQVKYNVETEGEDLVEPNDLFFCWHALFIASFTLIQSMWYGANAFQIKKPHDSILIVLLIAVTITFLLLFAGVVPLSGYDDVSLVAIFGTLKMVISGIKYVPQALLNFRRKSTVGWSIGNIWCDLTGGSLSFTQILIDCIDTQSTVPLIGNPAKLGLGLLSIFFDVFFLIQHYVVYKSSADVPLLSDEEARDIDMLVYSGHAAAMNGSGSSTPRDEENEAGMGKKNGGDNGSTESETSIDEETH